MLKEFSKKNPWNCFLQGPLVSLVGGKQVGKSFLHSFIAILPHYGNELEAGGKWWLWVRKDLHWIPPSLNKLARICWRQKVSAHFFYIQERYLIKSKFSFTCGWALCSMESVLVEKRNGGLYVSSPFPTHTHTHWRGEKFSMLANLLDLLGAWTRYQISLYSRCWDVEAEGWEYWSWEEEHLSKVHFICKGKQYLLKKEYNWDTILKDIYFILSLF